MTPPPELKILFEDNHLLVIDKPSGLLSQGDSTGDASLVDLVAQDLKRRYGKPGNVFVGLVHRLDRPVSGVMVVAKTSKAARRLTQQIRARTMRKRYLGVVQGVPEPRSGRLRHYLLKGRQRRPVQLLAAPAHGAKLAELSYEVRHSTTHASLVEVDLHTGRGHQIRAQLASLGTPLLGDRRYGSVVPPLPGRRLALHAHSLTFEHPTLKTPMTFEAPPPEGWPWPLPGETATRLANHEERVGPLRIVPSAAEVVAPVEQRGEGPCHEEVAQPPLDVVFRSDDLLVVAKPAGLPVQGTLDPARPDLTSQVEAWLGDAQARRPPALLTRLPSPASGLVVFALSRAGARCIEAQLQTRSVRRLFVLGLAGRRPAQQTGRWFAPAPGWTASVLGAAPGGGFVLALELASKPGRAIDELLRAQGWRVKGIGGADRSRRGSRPSAEQRHLGALRLALEPDAAATVVRTPAPPPWLPGDPPRWPHDPPGWLDSEERSPA